MTRKESINNELRNALIKYVKDSVQNNRLDLHDYEIGLLKMDCKGNHIDVTQSGEYIFTYQYDGVDFSENIEKLTIDDLMNLVNDIYNQ